MVKKYACSEQLYWESLLEDMSEEVANRVDEKIYNTLEGYICVLCMNDGENYIKLKVSIPKWKRWILKKLLNWNVYDL